MTKIATVELIYVAHSGRQYRARHVEAKVGWELDDLASKAKSDMSMRDYAIEFVNAHGHKQLIMPTDLETIIVNVVGVREEAWEEPAYDQLQAKWRDDLQLTLPDGTVATADHKMSDVSAPAAAKAKQLKDHLSAMHRVSPIQPVTPNGSTTQSIKITWPTAPKPQQRVNWPDPDNERTQPIKTIQGEVAGLSLDDATRVIERVAAGGSVTPGSD